MTSVLFLALASGAVPPASSETPAFIVGGNEVETCGWPTTVFTGGCTGTLIHPRAISTAQHCGVPRQIQFGERAGRMAQSVAVLGCVGRGSDDAMICELAEPVEDLPVTPVLLGCEVDRYMKVDQPVVIVGFGRTAFDEGGGTKLWADQTITAVEPDRVIIGDPGDGISPCPGDSGGPVFVQVEDGSWRVFGTVLGGTTGIPCNSAADFQRIDRVVANFEADRGLDITPCFDAATGAWAPTEDCTDFFSGDHTDGGGWAAWCDQAPATGASETCGPPYGEEPRDSDPPTDTEAPTDTDASVNEEVGGCGCSASPSPGLPWLLPSGILGGVGLLRRRSRRRSDR